MPFLYIIDDNLEVDTVIDETLEADIVNEDSKTLSTLGVSSTKKHAV